jgi:enoyl-CoA hydratase
LLTARPIDAQRAEAVGLVNEIVPAGQVLERAFEAADAIASNAPLAVHETRRGVREIWGLSLEAAYERQETIGRELRKSEDASEARRAFIEKRKPVWQGR